jgi:hypothetical protein
VKIENRQQLLVIITLAVAALLLGDWLIFSRLATAWKSRAQTIARLRTQVSEGALLVRGESAVRGRWGEMQTNALPANQSLAQEQMLKAFENCRQESGVSINGISAQWKEETDYQTLVCRVDAAGNLWTLARFLHDIERDPMALKIESVDLSSNDKTGQQLTLGLQVSGLVLAPQTR